jgi:NAD(P)H-flavin reductase
MYMPLNSFKLIDKKNLTNDVYELKFKASEKFNFLPGQFITFILPWIWGRAYSVLKTSWNIISLIIKSRAKSNGWRGWSEYICSREVWDILQWTNPAGKFLLQNNNKNKLFIWTGTGFVPLYNQIIHSLLKKQECKLELLFWARKLEDLFYITELDKLKENNSNFNYQVYLSREENTSHNTGYVTEYLNEKCIKNYDEFYICWIPALIDSWVKILEKNNIDSKNILTEKY